MYRHKYVCCLHVQQVKVCKKVDCFLLVLKRAKRIRESNVQACMTGTKIILAADLVWKYANNPGRRV